MDVHLFFMVKFYKRKYKKLSLQAFFLLDAMQKHNPHLIFHCLTSCPVNVNQAVISFWKIVTVIEETEDFVTVMGLL